MNIQLREPLSLDLSVKDTTICYGTALSIRAMAQGGLSGQYGYTWQNMLDNSILGIDSILTVQGITQNLKLRVILNDGCTLPMDTMELAISVLQPLNVALVSDVICSNDPITIKSNASGGKSADYKYKWFLDNVVLPDFTDSLKLQPSKLRLVKLVLEDNCSFFGDSASIEIAPVPNFDLKNVEIEVCEAYVPNWQTNALNGEIYSYAVKSLNDNKSYALNNMPSYMAGNYEWDILSTNTLGCSDSQKVITLVKALPNSDFNFTPDDPSFENPEVTFSAIEASAAAYNWFIDDVLEGKNKLLVKEFSKVGSYNVKLRVEENGCFSETEKSLEFLDTYRWLAVNAFSPNGDGLNDEYKPYVTGAMSLEYTIYNRWGEIVFKGDSGTSWDGTYQGIKVQSGTYLVIVSARDANFRMYNYKTVVYVL